MIYNGSFTFQVFKQLKTLLFGIYYNLKMQGGRSPDGIKYTRRDYLVVVFYGVWEMLVAARNFRKRFTLSTKKMDKL